MPDRRVPIFRFPEWVRLPAFLKPHLAARNSVKVVALALIDPLLCLAFLVGAPVLLVLLRSNVTCGRRAVSPAGWSTR